MVSLKNNYERSKRTLVYYTGKETVLLVTSCEMLQNKPQFSFSTFSGSLFLLNNKTNFSIAF